MEDTVNEISNSSETSGGTNDQAIQKPTKSIIAKNSGLKKCFSALVDRKQVNLDLEVLKLMLKRELQVSVDKLEPKLAEILPYMLVYYIKSWPGWQRSVEYYSGKTSFKAWYEKFYKFITLKLNQLIELHYGEAQMEIKKEKFQKRLEDISKKVISDRNTQTDSLAPKGFAPFTIEVTSKPVLLNTIVFTDTKEGDILLKQHSVLEWDQTIADNITVRQIITWPNVGVHLSSPVFSFSRKNLHEVCRHISVIGTALPNLHPKHIEDIQIIDQAEGREVYTIAYLRLMLVDLLAAFNCVIKSKPVIEAFQVIFEEFLADVEEMNIMHNDKVTMASNTFVLFNIGGQVYFRNKKLSKGTTLPTYEVGYTELVIPKMETSLINFASSSKFKHYLEQLRRFDASRPDNDESLVPQISFSCNFCIDSFETLDLLVAHLSELHKMEPAMLCMKCKRSYSPFHLSKSRWGHSCVTRR